MAAIGTLRRSAVTVACVALTCLVLTACSVATAHGAEPPGATSGAPVGELYRPQFTPAETNQPQTTACVKPVHGVPTLVIDGKPYGPMCLTRCAATYEHLRDFGDRDFPVHFEMVGSIGWPGEQAKVFERLDKRIHRFLDEIPNARIILRCYVCKVPPHFVKEHR